MSVVPHTRTHGLNPAQYTNIEDPIFLQPVTDIRCPVQFRVRDNGYPGEPQRWSYTHNVHNLRTLIQNFERYNNFRNPELGSDMDFNHVDPVRWEGDNIPPNLDSNYVTDTNKLLRDIRQRQNRIREEYAQRQAERDRIRELAEIDTFLNSLASIPRMDPHPPRPLQISDQPRPLRERILRDAQMARTRAATRTADEAQGRGSSGESGRDMAAP